MASADQQNESRNAHEETRDFFKPNGFQPALNRCYLGHEKAVVLTNFMTQVADAEADHSKRLSDLAQLYGENVVMMEEYGQMAKLCDEIKLTVEQMAESHSDFSRSLSERLIPSFRSWRKLQYKRSGIRSWEVLDIAKKQFLSIQTAWLQLLESQEQLKSEYEAQNPRREPETARDRAPDITRRQTAAEWKYEKVCKEIEEGRSKYESAMTEAFNTINKLEAERLARFATTFDEFGSFLKKSTEENERLKERIEAYHKAIASYTPEKDLKWWNNRHGPANRKIQRKPDEENDAN